MRSITSEPRSSKESNKFDLLKGLSEDDESIDDKSNQEICVLGKLAALCKVVTKMGFVLFELLV